jgi:hypothetical protein
VVGIASILILIPMLLAGLVIGLFCGALLSLQLLLTDKPLILPMHALCEWALIANSCNMNSVDAIQEMLKINSGQRGKIKIINTKDDQLIYPNASLCAGMKFPLEGEQEGLINGAHCSWHKGDHGNIRSLLKRNF